MNNHSLLFKKVTLAISISLILGTPISYAEEMSAQFIAEQVFSQTKAASSLKTDSNEVLLYDTSALSVRYKNETFQIMDISEMQLDGASSLVITFSMPVNPNQDFPKNITVIDELSGNLDNGWELSKNGLELRMRYLEPNRKLRVIIKPEITAFNNRPLSLPTKNECDRLTNTEYNNCYAGINNNIYLAELKTKEIKPLVGFGSRGSLLPSKTLEGLPITTLNVDKVDVDFFRIKPEKLMSFIKRWNNGSAVNYWDYKKYANEKELIYSGRFEFDIKRNQRTTYLLPIKEIDELNKNGAYFALMRQAGDFGYSLPSTFFTISNIGISTHRYNNKLMVFTQALDEGNILNDVKITVFDDKGTVLGEKTSDNKGMIEFDDVNNAFYLMATKGTDTSLLALNHSSLDLTEFDIKGGTYYDKQFFVFGPRDLYRPGETLYANALLRDADGKPLPDQPIKVDILKPDDEVLRSFVWQGKDGFYQAQVDIPESAATGKWALKLNLGDDKFRYYRFQVEDFLPERMAMDIGQPSQLPILSNQNIEFDIAGRYLYGAPASGNELQARVLLFPSRTLSQLPGFEIGSVTENDLRRELNDYQTKLNDQGLASFIVKKDEVEKIKSPVDVVLSASLLDNGGRPVTRLATQTVWAAETIPAIRPLFGKKETTNLYQSERDKYPIIDEDSNAEFEIANVNRQGEKINATELDVKLIRERRDYYWTWSESEGWIMAYNEKELVMARDTVSIENNDVAKVRFPVEWGAYRIEVSDPQTGLLSSSRFWAGWSWQDNTAGTGAVRPDQVKLKLDKPSYQLGETAKIHVEAPAAGQGYLMIESNDGPLWWSEISVPIGGKTFDVPLAQNWARHDLYLSAIILRPGDKKEHVTVKRAVGLLHLPINREAKYLDFAIDIPQKVEPNTTVNINIKANLKPGQSAEDLTVLLSAVDSGVLSINNYETPDPYEAFFGRKRYGVDQLDVYGQLIEGKGKLGKLKFGGDSDELERGGKKPPVMVQIVAQQLQPLVLNDKGEGSTTVNIPDFNGELRFMAQAWNKDSFGKTENKMTVVSPMVVELSAPRFLASGDKSILALELRNLSGQKQNITYNISADGAVVLQQAMQQQAELDVNERKILQIPVTAGQGQGIGNVAVSVQGIQLPDKPAITINRQWKLGVRPAYPAQTYSYVFSLENEKNWQLPVDNQLILLAPETKEAEMSLSSRLPLNIAQYIKELKAYPYGCLEQTVSGIYPSLYVNNNQMSLMGIKSETDQQRRKSIEIGIERLLEKQNNNGGFGLWNKSGQEEYWLTVYVTDFLLRAQSQGYSVNSAKLQSAITRLQRYIQDKSVLNTAYSEVPAYTQFATRAYAGLVLAKQNKVALSALRSLYDEQDVALSGLPLVQLGRALQIAGDSEKGNILMTAGVAKKRTESHYWLEDYGSKIRDEALILSLLFEDDLLPEIRDEYLFRLSTDLNFTRYLSTQEKNSVFMAGRFLMDSAEKPWKITVNDVEKQSSKPLSLYLASEQLTNGISVDNIGENKVYGHLNINGYPKVKPQPANNVLAINRDFYNMKGQPIDFNNIKSGDLVLVSLNIKSDKLVPDGLVVDLLPAGFELENQNLANSSVNLNDSGPAVQSLITAMQQTEIKYQEYRDDRYVAAITVRSGRDNNLVYLARAVTPGDYVVPPSYVESMYQPQWFAIGSAPDLLVIKP